MRQKRAKAYRKQMNLYIHTFKFREPFQTIIDSAIVLQAHSSSFDLVKGLSRTIQSEVKPMITQCSMQELYMSRNQQAIDAAKNFERRRCNHRTAIPGGECIRSIVDIQGENKHRYVVASQDENLRKQLRQVPGVPLVYMNRTVMVMEQLSKASAKRQEAVESRKLTGGLNDPKFAGINDANHHHAETKLEGEKTETDENENKESTEPPKKKRKGPKGPNPLSVKKKKTGDDASNKNSTTNEEHGETRKRRRRHHGSNRNGDLDVAEGDLAKEPVEAVEDNE